MAIFKRGPFYWFDFIYRGQRYCKSTRVRNKEAALDIESAFRTALAKGDVGITERKTTPTLKQFEKQFNTWVAENKRNLGTRRFYADTYSRLLDFSMLSK